MLRDLAGFDCCGSVDSVEFAGVDVVVDAEGVGYEAGARCGVGHDEVEDYKVRCVGGDGRGGQRVGGYGPEAQAGY